MNQRHKEKTLCILVTHIGFPLFTIRTLSAIREFLKNSTRSGECIDSKWLRALLVLHLMVTAICIMVFFPSIFRADMSVEYGAQVLQWLMPMAICGLSARLARGEVVARLPFWIVHGLWVLSVLVGVIWYWGAFETLGPEDVAFLSGPTKHLCLDLGTQARGLILRF